MRLMTIAPLCLSLACGGSAPLSPSNGERTTPAADPGAGGETATDEDSRHDATPALEVRLLEAGAEPRQALRFSIADGSAVRVRLTQQVATTISLGGHAMGSPMTFPIVTEMSMGPTRSTSHGALQVPFRIEAVELGRGVGITQAAREAAVAAVAPLRGAGGYIEMTPRGEITESHVDVPAQATSQVADMLENMRKAMVDASAPFPTEPVGVGARWEIHKRATRRGLTVEMVSTYTMTALDGGRGHYAQVISGSAPPQPFPVASDGTETELQSMSIRGAGQTDFDLGAIAVNSTSWVEVDMQAVIRSRGQSQGMQIHVRQETALEPLPADAQ